MDTAPRGPAPSALRHGKPVGNTLQATSDAIRWALARCPTLFVVDDETSRTLEDKPVTVKQVAEELGVRYVLK